ncbi:MAG: RIP metalloprotease RseP [Spirochaetales bacterium]|nr:RIP metalloprotease RseP [Spirochaetales bacterium]
MTVLTIVLGLAGLGVVVFFHELGHFAMARLAGVEVEEFSLGWGPRLISRKLGATAYTISAFPIGGYCRMKGEDSYRKAIEAGLDEFPRERGSYFGATPLRRILIAAGGPLMNVVFAFIVYTVIMASGYEVQSYENRIILASAYDGDRYPADEIGLETGDRISSINGTTITTFSELQEAIALSARKSIDLGVDRNGQLLTISVKPELDKTTGAGRVGVYPWVDTILAAVNPQGPAALAGLRPGDQIQSVMGTATPHTIELYSVLDEMKPERAEIRYLRDGVEKEATLVLSYDDGVGADLGISWLTVSREVRANGPLDALAMGAAETTSTISDTYRGLASLFMGVDLFKAVSGPARITWMVGTVAIGSVTGGGAAGASGIDLSLALNFLAILSIGLFAMNMLPIPLLDGGSIVLFIVELLRRKAAKVKTVLRYQTVGMVAVAMLLIVSTIGDVLFFSGK